LASARDIQLAKQVGEYLVAAELSRRGFQCATFSGNVPDYDIAAVDATGRHIPVQVKAIRTGSWQFDARRYFEIRLSGKKQAVGDLLHSPIPGLICVLVKLAAYGTDEFYLLKWTELQALHAENYGAMLKKHHGVRTKAPSSTHTIVTPRQVAAFRDNWDIIATGRVPGA